MDHTSKRNDQFLTSNAQQTMALGKRLAKTLHGGDVLGLVGDLGSGKTTFIKGLAHALGVKLTITSPTFVLFKVYPIPHQKLHQFVHVDCYRVPGIELTKVGLGDYLDDPNTIVAVEWADKYKTKFHPTITIEFQNGETSNQRIIKIKRHVK